MFGVFILIQQVVYKRMVELMYKGGQIFFTVLGLIVLVCKVTYDSEYFFSFFFYMAVRSIVSSAVTEADNDRKVFVWLISVK